MKIGDRIYVRGYVDEIRKDTVIVRNDGGYFGTTWNEVTPSAQPVQWIPCSYGFKRTGCACCPYGKDFDDELKVLEQHEPNLCKAVTNIFHDSYEYTRQYREFRKEMENK